MAVDKLLDWLCLMSLLSPLSFVFGWILDKMMGDPNRYHPIVGFGRLISWGEKRLNQGTSRRLKGAIYNGILILVPPAIYLLLLGVTYYSSLSLIGGGVGQMLFYSVMVLASNLVVFYMLSGTTLIREVRMVFEAVDHSLDAGRKQVGRIVGRDTWSLSEQEVRTAALETLSENLSDGVIAPMFWYMLLGIPGMLMYKMVNTQDSMIGYKNERYYYYGYFSAKLDDILNYIPARLTSLLMLLSAGRLDLITFVRKYGRAHASPNSGYPESALAGILSCRFGGPHDYFGKLVDKPYIGSVDRELTTADMVRAVQVNRRTEYLMVAIVSLFGVTLYGVVQLFLSLIP